ncbi:MAG: 7-carboxy-7-deazaguanine synthase QueE [Phycisphaerales bacterium]|nr:MAG: 7-carboxy-7-deazaguanine synthase QueE [Phycisphaerales bacterium]
MKVNEVFYSIQGEGFLVGVPSVFIRLAGCPLRCRWCDTKYAWEESAGIIQSVPEVVGAVGQWQCDSVVITGGEPMIDSDVPQLVRVLKAENKHVTIETAGIAYVPDVRPDLMSISPKLSNSTPDDPKFAAIHNRSRLDLAVLGALIDNYEYQLKFVVDSPDDLSEIQQTISQLANVDPKKVMLMPQATTREQLLAKSPMVADMCKSTGFAFCQRLQVLLYNGRRAR